MDYGNDTAAATNPLLYALGVSSAGADSGLNDTATGQNIYLYLESGVVVGRVGNATGAQAFTVSVNTAGQVTLTQLRSVEHDVDGSTAAAYDDAMTLSAANLITLTATATDRDGDQDSHTINIGQKLSFLDDGPTIGTGTALADVIVDEDMGAMLVFKNGVVAVRVAWFCQKEPPLTRLVCLFGFSEIIVVLQ